MSTLRLFLHTLTESKSFIQDVLRLGSAELKEQFAKIAIGVGFGLFAGLVFLLAIPFLVMGGIELLIAHGFSAFVAFFIGGGGLVLLALILGVVALASLKGVTFVPQRAINQLRRISVEAKHERV